jgi:RNA polymerase sigma factor (sigma-70 family)
VPRRPVVYRRAAAARPRLHGQGVPVEQKHPCEDVLADAKPLLNCAVKRLVESSYFAACERHDLRQELTLAVLDRWPKFDPERGTRIAFLSVVIGSRAAKLRRERMVYLRNYKPVPLEACDPADLDHQRQDDGPLLDRALDVQMLLDTLPPDLRQIAELLQVEPAAEVARRLGTTRHKLRSQLRQIRRHFRSLEKLNATENRPPACVGPG